MIAILLLLSAKSFTQSWSYTKHQSNFDGVFRIAYVVGEGSFPYTQPLFGERVQGDECVFLLTGVSNGSQLTKNSFRLKFDNGVEFSGMAMVSKDGELWSLQVDKEDMERELKNNNRFVVRLETPYSSEDYKFSLSGSTNAINKLK